MSLGARIPWTGARVVFDGQSLNDPIGITSGLEWPVRIMVGRGLPWANKAVSGAGWSNLTDGTGFASGQPASSRLHPQADNSASKTILILSGGQTDIELGDSGSTVMTDIVAYAAAARTAGFSHVIATTMPGSTNFDASEETARTDFNTLLLADAGGDFDEVADLAATALDDGSDTDYFHDGLHFTAAGHQLCADTVAPHLDTILAL